MILLIKNNTQCYYSFFLFLEKDAAKLLKIFKIKKFKKKKNVKEKPVILMTLTKLL